LEKLGEKLGTDGAITNFRSSKNGGTFRLSPVSFALEWATRPRWRENCSTQTPGPSTPQIIPLR